MCSDPSAPRPPSSISASAAHSSAAGKSSLENSIAIAASVDDASDVQRGGHLFLRIRNIALLPVKWRWVFCRVTCSEDRQSRALLVFDSIESSCDIHHDPLYTIPLTSARCFSLLPQATQLSNWLFQQSLTERAGAGGMQL
jgi:hypothetical protein